MQRLAKRRKLSQPVKRRQIAADALRWKSVEAPEMFEDAEGFFGLEEVHGVEVVRNGDHVQFLATDGATSEDEAFEGFEDEAQATEGQTQPGLTEEDTRKSDIPRPVPIPKSQNAKRHSTNEKSGRKTAADAGLESNMFAGLEEAADTQEDDADMSAWAALDLSVPLLSSIARLKFSRPTDIQARAIPEIMAGHDVIGKASTGSGKTLAFAIPIVEAWLARQDAGQTGNRKGPISLVLSPTRELAHQLTNHIRALCEGLSMTPYICSVTGGLSVHKQQRQLEKADIVIGTPGRLWEVLSGSSALMESFKGIGYLVVDEADRLLTEGHFKEAEEILKALDRTTVDEDEDEAMLSPRQTLVFSATFNKGLQQKLAGKGKFDLQSQAQSMEYLLKKLNLREERPKFIDVNPVSQMAQGLKEGLVECGAMEKDLYLYTLLLLQQAQHTLVFTNSIGAVRRLAPLLQNLNLPVHALHSQMPQKARLRSVERFTASPPGTTSILLATDVAARGLDIPGIDSVIHYHVPRTADAYIHRSGRTARAEQIGLSILICAPEEVVSTRRLVAKVHASSGGTEPTKVTKRKTDYYIRTLDPDRKLVGRLRERVVLAKKIADAGLAKEKGIRDDNWMRQAADDLGVVYDSSDEEQRSSDLASWGGRGSGRKAKEQEARGLSKGEISGLRAQLRELLKKRINTGVSERYVAASGHVDMNELLKGVDTGFLGSVGGLGVD